MARTYLYLEDFEIAKEIVGGVRTIRLQKNIPNKEALELQVLGVTQRSLQLRNCQDV